MHRSQHGCHLRKCCMDAIEVVGTIIVHDVQLLQQTDHVHPSSYRRSQWPHPFIDLTDVKKYAKDGETMINDKSFVNGRRSMVLVGRCKPGRALR